MLAFAATALAILILNCWHVDNAAHPRLAAQMGQEGPHQLLQIDPVGLGAPGATVHLDAGGIDLMIDEALLHQPAMQPMAVEACLVARQDAYRLTSRGSLLAYIGKSGRQGHQVTAADRVAAQFLGAGQQHAELPFRFAQFKGQVNRGMLRCGGCVSAIELDHLGPPRLGGLQSNPNLS